MISSADFIRPLPFRRWVCWHQPSPVGKGAIARQRHAPATTCRADLMATGGQISCPPAGNFLSVSGQFPLSADNLSKGDLFDNPRPRAAPSKVRVPQPRGSSAGKPPKCEHTWLQVKDHIYVDATGEPVQKVIRKRCATCDEKKLSQGYYIGGAWTWSKPEGFVPVLYREPDVRAAVADGREVVIMEGEKDVEIGESVGLIATTNAGGAANFPAECAEMFRGASVSVVLVRDKAGFARGVELHGLLTAVGARVRLYLPAVEEEKADFTDHLAAGKGVDDLVLMDLDEIEILADLEAVYESALQGESDMTIAELDGGPNLPAINSHANSSSEHLQEADKLHRGQTRMAYRLAKKFTGKLLYAPLIGWHFWNGKRWVVDEEAGAAHQAVLRTLLKALHDSLGDSDLRDDVRRCESASAQQGVLTIASKLDEFKVSPGDLDADPYLLNVANGTLDLHTMTLRPHDPADRITKITRGAFRPNDSGGATWLNFLDEMLPDTSVREFVQRLIGVSLLGKVVEHILPIWTGTGANGKGTTYKALVHCLGDYAAIAEPDLFMAREGAHPTGQMALFGRRLVVVSESDKGRRPNSAIWPVGWAPSRAMNR